MKAISLVGVVAWSALQFRLVSALSNITFYSDNACSTVLSYKTGPDDGTCTQFPANSEGFLSFMVTSLDQTCAVTVYGSDIPYCSSANLYVAPFSDCIPSTNVSQFSVDCQDLSVATSAVPSVVPTGGSSPTAGSTATGAASSSSGLSGGAKAGIGIGAAVGGLALIAILVLFVVRNNRKKKADMEAKRAAEADSNPAAPPYHAEMPQNEKKPPMEMSGTIPAHEMVSSNKMPVEAPSEGKWPPPQELPGDYAPTEVAGSQVPDQPDQPDQQGDNATVLSSENKTLVGSESKRDSKSAPLSPS